MYTLAQLHKLHTKKFLNFWISKDPHLKANLFLSFQTVQKMHNGMEFQVFFLFFPIKEPLQLSNTSITDSGNTHWTPKMTRAISQRVLTSVQCNRIWFAFSSSQPHKKHRLGMLKQNRCIMYAFSNCRNADWTQMAACQTVLEECRWIWVGDGSATADEVVLNDLHHLASIYVSYQLI